MEDHYQLIQVKIYSIAQSLIYWIFSTNNVNVGNQKIHAADQMIDQSRKIVN